MRLGSFLRHLLIILGYFVVALVVVGHLPSTLMTHFIGSDTGDNYEMARNVWWFTFAIQNGEPILYQTWLGYPDGINGIILLTLPLQYFPMWGLAFFMPLQVAYNFTVLLWMALNGWSVYFLARYLLENELEHNTLPERILSPLLAGLVYMAFPLFQGHLAEGHGGLMMAWAAPLYIWALFRYSSTKTHLWRWLLISIFFFYLSTTGHILQSIYVLIPVTGTFLLAKLWQRDWVAVKRVVGMGILASIVLLIALFPAILDATTETSYTSTGGYTRYSTDLLALVSPSFLHPTFDSLLDYPRAVLGRNLGEGLAYLGIIVTILSVIAIVKVRAARWWFLLGAIAWLFALGPELKLFDEPLIIAGNTIPLPFAILQDLPGFSLARTPARFNFTLAIAVAMLVAYGLGWLWRERSGSWRYAVAFLLAIGILWEYQSFWAQPIRTADLPEAITNLRDDDDIQAIFNIPYQHALAAKDALYLQTGHEHPLIAGQITRTTPVNPAMLAMLQGTLDPMLLNQAGADIVILHRSRATEIGQLDILENRANEQLGEAIYRDEQFAIYRVPETSNNIGLSYEIERPNIALSGDMVLLGHQVFEWDNVLYVWLQWQFNSSRPDTDVRFVHIVDAAGEIVLQNDEALGNITNGDIRTELLTFNQSDLDTGNYIVRVGWYDFNTVTNYLSDDGQAAIVIDELIIP